MSVRMLRGATLMPWLAALVLAGSVGCSSKSTGGDLSVDGARSDGGGPDSRDGLRDGPAGQLVTLFDINSEKVAAGTLVRLAEVVVTAVDGFEKYLGDVYVQDPAGGPKSGIRIFGAKRGDGGKVEDLKAGDRVSVVGKVLHFSLGTGVNTQYPDKKYIRELGSAQVFWLKAGAPPAPKELTGEEAIVYPGAEAWEHVLVKVKDLPAMTTADAYGEFELSGGPRVDNELYAHAPQIDDCLTVTGILSFYFNYKVQPRSAADVEKGTACVPPKKVTIQALQDASLPDHPKVGSRVTVSGVVSAVDVAKDSAGAYDGFYIQDPQGGPFSGLFVYSVWTDASPASARPLLHELVEVTGVYDEFPGNNLTATVTELKNVTWVNKGQQTPVAPVSVSAAVLGAGGSAAAPYQGVLVKTDAVEATTILIDAKGVSIGFTDKPSGLHVVNKLYDFMSPAPPIPGTKYISVVGVISTMLDFYELNPRAVFDLTKAP